MHENRDQPQSPNHPVTPDSAGIVVAAPMSFTGSAQRIWRALNHPVSKWLLGAFVLIPLAWTIILCWYVVFGVFLVPYRMVRRSQRRERQRSLQHQEMLSEMRNQNRSSEQP